MRFLFTKKIIFKKKIVDKKFKLKITNSISYGQALVSGSNLDAWPSSQVSPATFTYPCKQIINKFMI